MTEEKNFIENKVANSGLITIELEELLPDADIVFIDLKDVLYEGLILREKDFRAYIKTHDWEEYRGKIIGIFCSADAIIPQWAFMLIASSLSGIAYASYIAEKNNIYNFIFHDAIQKINAENYLDARVVIKGCSKIEVPSSAYFKIAEKLKPFAKSIMYGEPCSTVPVYKKNNTQTES